MKKNNNVVTGRATEGGAKFERGSRGGAEKESGWSSGRGLCRKIYPLRAVAPQWGPAALALGAHTFTLWSAALPGTSTNQPALLFNRLLFTRLTHVPPCVQRALTCSGSPAPSFLLLLCHCVDGASKLFFLDSFPVTRSLLIYVNGLFSLLRYKECADILGPSPRVYFNLIS